jgi:hypothetical protein
MAQLKVQPNHQTPLRHSFSHMLRRRRILIRDQAISASRAGGGSRFSCAPACSSLVVTSSAPHLLSA